MTRIDDDDRLAVGLLLDVRAFGRGTVRVRLGDSLWRSRGRLSETNSAQVLQARKIIEGLGLEIATPDEAREILALKGADKTAF